MNILMANIGSRDVTVDGKILTPARVKGEEIFTQLDNYKNCIELPILNPAIEYILERQNKKLSKLHLFLTDQNDLKYRRADNIWFGKIIKRLLSQKRRLTR